MNAIVVVDKNWGIGQDGKLLVHLPGDLKYFKQKTLGKTIIMGRKTLESVPGNRPLRDRETILLTKTPDYQADCPVCHTLDALMEMLRGKNPQDVFVAGGESVYSQLLAHCDTFYITKVDASFEADRHFPNLDALPEEFEVTWMDEGMEDNGIKYQFMEYKRKKPVMGEKD